jgi:transposase InsO family protein
MMPGSNSNNFIHSLYSAMILVRLIREIVTKHHRRYGSPRVRQELRMVYGKKVSLKKVARLMRENGLNAQRRGQTRNIVLMCVKTY